MSVNECKLFTLVNGVVTGKTLRLRSLGSLDHYFEGETGSTSDIHGCNTRASPWVVYPPPPPPPPHHHHHHGCCQSFNFCMPL